METIDRSKLEIIESKCLNSVIRRLQKIKDACLSGDDSGLSNVWNEICVQEQRERSFYYESYIDLIELTVDSVVSGLNEEVLNLLWLETEAGQEWSCDNPGVKKPPFTDLRSVGEYLTGNVMAEANNYENKEIRDFCNF